MEKKTLALAGIVPIVAAGVTYAGVTAVKWIIHKCRYNRSIAEYEQEKRIRADILDECQDIARNEARREINSKLADISKGISRYTER